MKIIALLEGNLYLLYSDNIKAESNITIVRGNFQVRNPREFKLLATYLQPPRAELELISKPLDS